MLASPPPLLLLDVWGVLHDGATPFEDAPRFLARLSARGCRIRLVSNASWTANQLGRHLRQLGFDLDAIDAIHTAGDEARHLVRSLRPKGVFHEGLAEPVSEVPHAGLEDCDLVVFANLTEQSEHVLSHALKNKIPIVCANPDLAIWDRQGRATPKAGSLARRFEAAGATVLYAGKPHPPIFQRAAPEGAPLIGDSPTTDLAGAQAAGIPSIWLRRRHYENEAAILERYAPARVIHSLDELWA